MVQLSDITKPFGGAGQKAILAGEVHALWNFLTLRYLYLEMTQVFKNYIEDTEFGMITQRQIYDTLDSQIEKVEKVLKDYNIILPPKPPKSVNTAVNSEALRDEMMYRLILVGVQYFLETHAETLRMMSNDALRNLFMGWIAEEMKIFDNLVKYGKLKGWYWGAPAYQH